MIDMKYQAVVFVILICVTIFFAGCKEQPWEDCGPAGLTTRVPLGVTVALEIALSPRGMITMLTTKDGNNDTLICDDNQSITYGPAYREASFNSEVESSSSEDIFVFQDRFRCELYCHGQDHAGIALIGKMFNVWLVHGVGTGGESLAALEEYLGPDFSECARGMIKNCAIVTDKQGITRFYPLDPDDPIWDNPEGKKIGEFSLTEEEYLEWYYNNIDLLQANASLQ
ncbi:MAG: hypothetical protein JW832_17985 [Deltaproteobacteria bacterium]|nr:hypothetical protein [Deltaproteobacteria bacterium]